MNKPATLVGCAIGDALGGPFENKSANNPNLLSWDGLFKAGGTFWKGEAGQYTDDTLMSLGLSLSLLEKDGFDPEHIANSYLAWYNSGNTRGIGTTTASAIMNLKLGATWQESGLIRGHDGLPAAGNGTAMRASPLGLWYRNDLEKLLQTAMLDASITHNSHEPKMGSVAVALGTSLIVNGMTDTMEVLETVSDIVSESVVKDKLLLAIQHLKDHTSHSEALVDIGVSGYVPETVGAAFYCLGATYNFRDAVVMAVRAGGDTDSTGAVLGALAGSLYGMEGIPEEYKSVENFQLLQDLTDELMNNKI